MLQVLRQNNKFLLSCVAKPITRKYQQKTDENSDPYDLTYRLSKFILMPEQNIYMVRPYRPVADNVVVFHVDMKFSKFEIKNYLEQIYGLKVKKVNTMIKLGQTLEIIPKGSFQTKKHKFPDKKVAYVLLAEGKFTYPDVSSAFFTSDEIKREFVTGSKEDDEGDEPLEDVKKKKPKYPPIKGTAS
ncbi:hypothetical protein LOD99_7240 [Oopsacas minuta]|uniref:Large ribosomal subunit protein uL23m n=1 Tax=Oopsacas minuta TaxID=111878 RepID=A0AAV7JU49_9METZ|nr:hypothetical protein LOD99_7240 [Oopsacas minuta]